MNQLFFSLPMGKRISAFGILKISIIVFVSYSLFANAIPYYEGADAYVYGISAIQLAQGNFGFTNQLLEETGNTKYVPQQWVKTISNTAIPIGGLGIYGLSSLFYLLGGYVGLLYLSPIFTIILMIGSERFATKYFGSFVGFVTLILIASDWKTFQIGLELLNDNVFALFFILGIFFLLKFLHKSKENYLLLSTIFFVASTFFKINGIIFLPLELLILLSFYLVTNYKNTQKHDQHENIFHTFQLIKIKKIFTNNLKIKSFFKINSYIFLPWLVFFIIWSGYNSNFFGDSISNYEAERLVSINKIYTNEILLNANLTGDVLTEEQLELIHEIEKNQKINIKTSKNALLSFITFDSERFWWINYYAVSIIPDTLENFLKFITDIRIQDDWKSINWMSIFSLTIIILSLVFVLYYKNKRTEVFVCLLFIMGFLLFFSADYIHPSDTYPPSGGIRERYMIPVSILSFTLFGFIINRVWRFDLKKIFSSMPSIYPKTFKIMILSGIILFFIGTVYIMPSVQAVLQEGFIFNNPSEFIERFPLDVEGLSNESIVIGDNGRRTVEYGAIHLYPYEGFSKKDPDFKPENLNFLVILDLIFMINEGRDVYVFKKDMRPLDEIYFRYLEDKHGFLLKNYSETFCKFELITKNYQNNNEAKSDPICYSDIKNEPKVWKIWLKTPWEIIESKK